MTKRIKWTESAGRVTATLPNGLEYVFSIPSKSYVFCDLGISNAVGSSGWQCCHGGGTTGSAMSAAPETLGKVARAWMRAYLRDARRDGYFYMES